MEILISFFKYNFFRPYGKFVIGFLIFLNINISHSISKLFISYEDSSIYNFFKLISLVIYRKHFIIYLI